MTPTDRKISSTTIEMITKTLGKKADEPWVKDMLSIQKEGINEAKEIALSVKRDLVNRGCQQKETIDEIMKTINGWKTVRLGAVIAVFVFLAGGVAQYFSLTSSVAEIKGDVKDVTQAVGGHLEWTEKEKQNAEQFEAKRLQAISEVITVAIEKANEDNNSKDDKGKKKKR